MGFEDSVHVEVLWYIGLNTVISAVSLYLLNITRKYNTAYVAHTVFLLNGLYQDTRGTET